MYIGQYIHVTKEIVKKSIEASSLFVFDNKFIVLGKTLNYDYYNGRVVNSAVVGLTFSLKKLTPWRDSNPGISFTRRMR
jgi:hypothetical protein